MDQSKKPTIKMDQSKKPTAHENSVYIQSYIWKKEGLNNWINYLGVVRGPWFLFYDDPEGEKRGQLRKTFELPTGTKCSLAPRRKKRFPFSVHNGHAMYYLKTETELQRHQWIFCILLSSTNKPPQAFPKSVPKQFAESTMFPRMTKFEKKLEVSNNKRRGKLGDEFNKKEPSTNKRRQRYVKRMENKQRTKENSADDDCYLDKEEYSRDIPGSARSVDAHGRNHSRDLENDEYSSRRKSTGDIVTDFQSVTSISPTVVKVSAQIHSPIEVFSRTNKSNKRPDIPLVNVSEAVDDTTINSLVIANENVTDNLLLPNMVIEDLELDDVSHTTNNKCNNMLITDITGRSDRLRTGPSISNSASMTDLVYFTQLDTRDVIRPKQLEISSEGSCRPKSAKTYKEANLTVMRECNPLSRGNSSNNLNSSSNLIYLSPQLPRKPVNSPSHRQTYSRHMPSSEA